MPVYENLVGTVHVVRTVLVLLQGLYSTRLEQTSIAFAQTFCQGSSGVLPSQGGFTYLITPNN
jgi:hypothetical protein